jgi:hypothetical protein
MLTAPTAAPTRTRRRRSRAKPRPPRQRAVVMAELRGLGGLVLEQALLDAGAEPIPSLVAWANRLAGELGVQEPGSPATYRAMMRALVDVNRRAGAAAAVIAA